jgi:hypothetical protein
MCDVKEAQRHEQLAEIYGDENDKIKAIDHYLEATAIYVLNIQMLKDESLLLKANECYQQVQRLRGEKMQKFTKTELAKLVVEEKGFRIEHHNHTHKTNTFHHHHNHNHNHNHDNLLSEIEELL